MENVKYLIIGAGAAGLTVANRLKEYGEDSVLLLEKAETVGGLCRSTEVDGSPLDIGGGHFLDTRRADVTEYLFRFMPETEWNRFERNSKISLNGRMVDHPLEANIWQLELEDQIEYLKSIAQAGCNTGEAEPEAFIRWIYWKLGKRIAEDYMIPYNQKIFCGNLDQLGTYWLDKLPDVSFEETLRSCLTHKAYGKEPGHSVFYYPKKYGYGKLWELMGDRISACVLKNKQVKKISSNEKNVFCTDGSAFHGTYIINTAPWDTFELPDAPDNVIEAIKALKHSSVQIEYIPENMDSDAQWIYYPEKALRYHRILLRHNFCPESKGYWTETNSERKDKNKKAAFSYLNEYAYPLNTIEKPQAIELILRWAETKSIIGLGRWGEFQHFNSDVTVERALALARRLTL